MLRKMQRFYIFVCSRMHSRHTSVHLNATSQSSPKVLVRKPLLSHTPPSLPLRSCLRVGFLCGFVYWMQPLLEAIRTGFPHYLPVSTETRQCYGNASPSHGAKRMECRGFTIEDNGTRTHTYTEPLTNAYTRTHFTSEESLQCSSGAFIMQIQSCIWCHRIKDCAHQARLWKLSAETAGIMFLSRSQRLRGILSLFI